MNSVPRAYTYFRVAAEILPLEEISAAIGCEPTSSWRKGDPGRYNPARPDSGWCLNSPLPESNTCIESHIEALLPLLEFNAEAVKKISEQYQTYLVCVGHFNETARPAFHISKQTLVRIASLGVSIDADLYCLGC